MIRSINVNDCDLIEASESTVGYLLNDADVICVSCGNLQVKHLISGQLLKANPTRSILRVKLYYLAIALDI